MCLAKPNATIEKKRIVGSAGVIRNSQTGGMSKLIAGTDNKIFKTILRIIIFLFGFDLFREDRFFLLGWLY